MSRLAERLVLIDYLQRALDSVHGIELEFLSEPDARYFRERIGQVRKDQTEYQSLALIAKGNRLWIAKKTEEPVDDHEVT